MRYKDIVNMLCFFIHYMHFIHCQNDFWRILNINTDISLFFQLEDCSLELGFVIDMHFWVVISACRRIWNNIKVLIFLYILFKMFILVVVMCSYAILSPTYWVFDCYIDKDRLLYSLHIGISVENSKLSLWRIIHSFGLFSIYHLIKKNSSALIMALVKSFISSYSCSAVVI